MIILLSWTGELLNKGLGIPIPGAIIGMVLLTLLLTLKIIKLPQVEEGADKLLSVLALFFVPLFVKLLEIGPILANYGGKLVILLVTTTILVMVVTAFTAKLLLSVSLRREKR